MYESIVIFKMDSGINVKVDRGDIIGIKPSEIEDQLEELFRVKKKYKSKEVIPLSNICDVCFDLMFCSSNKENKEMSFKLC